MKIQLVSSHAECVKISARNNRDNAEELFKLSHGVGFNDNDNETFVIHFDLFLRSEQKYEIEITYLALFKVDEEMTEDFKKSHFTKVNAPAIAYPYLRSCVSTLLLIAGYEPAILPTLNFQAMVQNEPE